MIARRWQALRRLPRGIRQDPVSMADDGPLLDDDLLRQINLLSLTSGDALTEWLMGEHEGRRKTQAVEFDDYRNYVPGDDLRLIDWHAYARLGELLVKTSRAPENIVVSLLFDCSRSMDWGRPSKLRYGKRLAAMLGALALINTDHVRTYALGDGTATPSAPLQGPGALAALVDDLERQPLTQTLDLARCLESFISRQEPRGLVVLISDLLIPAEEIETIGILGSNGTAATVLHVVDAAEADPPLHGTLDLRDHESGETTTISVTSSLHHRYVERFADHARALEAACARNGIQYVLADTRVPPADLLARMF